MVDRGGRHRHRLPRHVERKVMVRRGANRGHMSDRAVDRSLRQRRRIVVGVVAISIAILDAHGVRHSGRGRLWWREGINLIWSRTLVVRL